MTLKGNIIMLCFLVGVSCNQGQTIKEYEEGGYRGRGPFLHDSIKTGEHYSYYCDGNIRSISRFDSSGNLNGPSVIYHQNGRIQQERFFVDDVVEGPVSEYYKAGNIKSRGYFLNGKNVGNVYHYHDNGKMSTYNFYDFNGNNLIYLSSDTGARIGRVMGMEQFLSDSLIVMDENVLRSDTAELWILLAAIPGFHAEAKVEELDANSRILSTRNVGSSETMIKIQFQLSAQATRLKLEGTVLDSISGKKKTVISHYEIL